MNKDLIKNMIQEKKQMIEMLQMHIQQLQHLLGGKGEEPAFAPKLSVNNIPSQIESYRQKIMENLNLSLPNTAAPTFGMGNVNVMPGHFQDMEKKFEQMKNEVEGNIKR